jgi:glucosyl-3-phosphoglycerate synthase
MSITGAGPTRVWAEANSWDHPSWTVAELERAKGGRTVSVV